MPPMDFFSAVIASNEGEAALLLHFKAILKNIIKKITFHLLLKPAMLSDFDVLLTKLKIIN